MKLKSELIQSIPEALANFDQLPDSAYIRLPVMKGLYGVSSASIWRGVKNLTIPKPSKLTERTTAWNVGQVRAALAAKAGV
ncbi:helix-turn-helix transcriptional regulator [Methylotenera versatilis]|uniref:Putative transcriptional regulator n=1 Tax=Methylotenera versatilis (strain 301) TaxID=666681 RepID=D7DHJ7_METV0|nr:AlpA family phage regulatory protein [Methylotenera versatilis]ADI29532.1 putative transcriptional regulator [Methylotenera versatilis 301]